MKNNAVDEQGPLRNLYAIMGRWMAWKNGWFVREMGG